MTKQFNQLVEETKKRYREEFLHSCIKASKELSTTLMASKIVGFIDCGISLKMVEMWEAIHLYDEMCAYVLKD